jgi:signal transduction histidine kinase/CheY-like chemotaxis protein
VKTEDQTTVDGTAPAEPDHRLAELQQQAEAAACTIAALRQRIAELENANQDARKSRLATLNVLEDAVASRRLADALNRRLQMENDERRRAEDALRESTSQLETALEAARVAHQAKDQFIAALSHELRTPLTPILLGASLGATDETLPKKVRTRFAMIKANIEVEARLIDDLLDQTQIAHGHVRLAKTIVDAQAILEEAFRTTAGDFNAKGIQLIREFRAKATKVEGDPVRLQQIFWNVLRNAVKFTPTTGSVIVRTADCGESRLAISITDTGIGLTAAEIERIFQPFTQGDHANPGSSRRFGGLGLGLTISQKLTELHGGRLTVSSPGPGLGATFTLELPCLGCAVPPPVAPKSAQKASPPGLRILLVEDHEATRAVLRNLLNRRGHQATAAGSVAEALRKATGAEIDVLISDLGLPDGTGAELLKQILLKHPGLPAIALSGFGMENDLRQTQQAGFIAHLVKPISIEQLEAALEGVKPRLKSGRKA